MKPELLTDIDPPELAHPDEPGRPSPESPQEIIFFYIGKPPAQGKLLIDTFYSGFFCQDINSAAQLFIRTRAEASHPVFIIFNGILGESKLHDFFRQLPSNIKHTVPVFIDATRLEAGERQAFARINFVNELISLRDLNGEKLLASARFICKIKAINGKIQLETRRFPVFMRSIESRQVAKRIIDIVISASAIVFLSPLFLLIALAIVIESRGPILYISQRAGRGYKIFRFYKFRTMIPGPEGHIGQVSHLNSYAADSKKGPLFFKATNDPRITRVGALLRSTSLDELPQFFNVLFGEMSLVGNRPLPLYEAETLTSDECAVRFLAPAGITGLWQVKKRGSNDLSAKERVDLDIAYAHKNNLMYDLWIMANTPSALLQKSNA
jgi:lipopolysaccharide/colanic/teichoic acid biosynthesis glycosyltransferase